MNERKECSKQTINEKTIDESKYYTDIFDKNEIDNEQKKFLGRLRHVRIMTDLLENTEYGDIGVDETIPIGQKLVSKYRMLSEAVEDLEKLYCTLTECKLKLIEK